MRAGLVFFLVWAAGMAALAPSSPAAEPIPTFSYLPVARNLTPVTVPDRSAGAAPGATLIAIGAPHERPIAGMFVGPAQDGGPRHPAVLWVHWLGEPATTDHTEFLSDARALATRGVVSLLVDMPWSKPDWFDTRRPSGDAAEIVADVVALRRALDVLMQQNVDPARVAYVGHDFGAMDGALLLAVDSRPRFAVLMAPTLSFWEWYLLGTQPADPAAYVAQMSAFDLPRWLTRNRQRATLLQFGKNDTYVSRATAAGVRNALPDRDRTYTMYDADHALDVPAAHDDRRAWLLAHFGLAAETSATPLHLPPDQVYSTQSQLAVHAYVDVSRQSVAFGRAWSDSGSAFFSQPSGPVLFQGLDPNGKVLFEQPVRLAGTSESLAIKVGSGFFRVPVSADVHARLHAWKVSYAGHSVTQTELPPAAPVATAIALDREHVRVMFDGRYFSSVDAVLQMQNSLSVQNVAGNGTATSSGDIESTASTLSLTSTTASRRSRLGCRYPLKDGNPVTAGS